jgi:hypothetical protein
MLPPAELGTSALEFLPRWLFKWSCFDASIKDWLCLMQDIDRDADAERPIPVDADGSLNDGVPFQRCLLQPSSALKHNASRRFIG